MFRIVAGEHDLTVESGLEQIREISDFVKHPGYSVLTLPNNIALAIVNTDCSLLLNV